MPTTVSTTSGDFQIPDYTDAGDVPLWLRTILLNLGNNVLPNLSAGILTGTLAALPTTFKAKRLYVVLGDTTLANNGRLFYDTGTAWQEVGLKVVTGTLAARPTTFVGNRLYVVLGDATTTNNGLVFWDTGSAWQAIGGGSTVRAVASAAADVPVRSTGVASQTGNFYEAVTSAGAVAFAVKATGRLLIPAWNVAYTYNTDGSVATMTETLAGVTVRTITFTYNSDGTVASSSDVHDGVTDAATYAYTTANGQTVPSSVTRTRTVN